MTPLVAAKVVDVDGDVLPLMIATTSGNHTGAAELGDADACMTDADDDGFGESAPSDGVTAA